MVLGIGEGRIQILQEKGSYAPGEALRGKIILQLDTIKKARSMRIQFYGERKRRSGRGNSTTERIMIQELILDGEKEYAVGSKTYDFQFQLPILQKPQESSGGGVFGGVLNFVSRLSDPYAGVTWHLDASLDIPMSFDINAKQIVNLVR